MVSIIIPIYNTGEYLHLCLESVCKQTYQDLQIIMVDDGSMKETAMICDEIASTDSRIQVIHKKNEGVSIARNVGLEIAKGDVICFVDSDDTIDPYMIERFVAVMEETKAQIVMCDAVTIKSGGLKESDTITQLANSCTLSKNEITPSLLLHLAGSACRCAYRLTDKFAKQAHFPIDIKFSEDRIFNIVAMGLAGKIAYIKEPYYNRLIRQGSACFRFYPDMTEQIVKMRKVMMATVKKFWGEDYIKTFEKQIAGQICHAITNYTALSNGLSISQKLKALDGLCQNPEIRSCITNSGDNDLRSRMILNGNYILLSLIGILTNKYHKLCKKGQYRQ